MDGGDFAAVLVALPQSVSHSLESSERARQQPSGFVDDFIGEGLVMHAWRGDGVSQPHAMVQHIGDDLHDASDDSWPSGRSQNHEQLACWV